MVVLFWLNSIIYIIYLLVSIFIIYKRINKAKREFRERDPIDFNEVINKLEVNKGSFKDTVDPIDFNEVINKLEVNKGSFKDTHDANILKFKKDEVW